MWIGRFCRGATAVALVWLTAGCGGREEYAEVSGTVLSHGKPVPNVEVTFYPDPERGSTGPQASGVTDPQGHFRLATRRTDRAGVVVGTHRVTFNRVKPPPEPGDAIDPARPAKLPITPPKRPAAAGGDIPFELRSVAGTPFRDVSVKPGGQAYRFELDTKRFSPE